MENQDSVPKTVLQCASLFKSAKTDNDRFASLFLVTKVIKGEYCNEASLKVLYDAIGFPFLDRLLRASEVPDDCPPSIYKSIALSIASVFCGVPEIVNSDSIRSIIPILLNIISMKDSEDEEDMDLMLVSDCYECLHSISRCQSGRDALLVMGASKYLMEIYVEENFRHDEALKLLHHLVVLEGSSVWNGNESLFSELIHRICGEFISESSEKKFEICKILALLLCNSPKGFSDQDLLKSSWPKELFLALEGILCSRVGTGHRDVALQLMARILELLGIEWGLSTSPNSHQFLLLLINLACVEVRMKLEDKTLEQALNSGDILVACYTVIELFISFMTSQSFLEFDQKQRDQAYCALKGAVSAILGLLLQVHQDGTDWESTALDKRVTFVCASGRILGAWLAEEASSMKKEVCAVLPLIMSLCWNMYRRRTAGDDQAIDMLRFMLPALCHLAAEDLSRQILVKQSLHQLLYDYLLQQWELFTKWLKQQPTLAADWLHAETQEQADRAEKARPDSEAAVILVCSVLMNLVVLEPLMCQQHAVFIQLLRFIMAQVPKLIKCQDFLILHGNLAVLGLLILRHHSWKYRQGDSTVFRYIKDTVSFLWDAHNSEDSSQQMAMVISLRYKKDWPDLAELWFLGMQSLSNLLTNMDWIVDFIVDSGWPQEMVKSLGRVSASAIDANTRTAYEDFLCCLVKAQPKVKQIIKESGGKQVCRTHSMRLLLAQLNADPVPASN